MSVSRSIWLYRWLFRRRAVSNAGFTLTELLISLFIVGIVFSTLLYLVVELLRVDRRELALDQVQRDVQRAVDYMADDLKEAVFVYSTPTQVTTHLEDLSTDLAANNGVPVLAFWRPVPIEATLPADCSLEGTNEQECSLLKTRRATYSLVVYYQQPPSGVYEGNSHIRRYELAQYVDLTATGTARYTQRNGYADPITEIGTTNFETWSTTATNVDSGTNSVLVDYIDAISLNSGSAYNCQTLLNDANAATLGAVGANDYVLSPPDAALNQASFFACIRNINAGDSTFRTGQDVYLFVRGDAVRATAGSGQEAFEAGVISPASDTSRLPILRTQVRVRGIINKEG